MEQHQKDSMVFFHEKGKGVYYNLKEEAGFDWELTEPETLTVDSETSSITFEARHYREISPV